VVLNPSFCCTFFFFSFLFCFLSCHVAGGRLLLQRMPAFFFFVSLATFIFYFVLLCSLLYFSSSLLLFFSFSPIFTSVLFFSLPFCSVTFPSLCSLSSIHFSFYYVLFVLFIALLRCPLFSFRFPRDVLILFCSALLSSLLLLLTRFLFGSVPFCSVLFCTVLFYSVRFYPLLFDIFSHPRLLKALLSFHFSLPFSSFTLIYSFLILLCSVLYCSLRFFSFSPLPSFLFSSLSHPRLLISLLSHSHSSSTPPCFCTSAHSVRHLLTSYLSP